MSTRSAQGFDFDSSNIFNTGGNVAAPNLDLERADSLQAVEGLTEEYYQKVGAIEGLAKNAYNQYGIDITQPSYGDPDAMLMHKTYLKSLAEAQNTANTLQNAQKMYQTIANNKDFRMSADFDASQDVFDPTQYSYATTADQAVLAANERADSVSTQREADEINTRQTQLKQGYLDRAAQFRQSGQIAQAESMELQASAVNMATMDERLNKQIDLIEAQTKSSNRANRNTGKSEKENPYLKTFRDAWSKVGPELRKASAIINEGKGFSQQTELDYRGKQIQVNREDYSGSKVRLATWFTRPKKLMKDEDIPANTENLTIQYLGKDPSTGQIMTYFQPIKGGEGGEEVIPEPMPWNPDNIMPFVGEVLSNNKNNTGISQADMNEMVSAGNALGLEGFEDMAVLDPDSFSEEMGTTLDPEVIKEQYKGLKLDEAAKVLNGDKTEAVLDNGYKVKVVERGWWGRVNLLDGGLNPFSDEKLIGDVQQFQLIGPDGKVIDTSAPDNALSKKELLDKYKTIIDDSTGTTSAEPSTSAKPNPFRSKLGL